MSSDPVDDPRKSEDYELISNGDVGSDTDQALNNGSNAVKETTPDDTLKLELTLEHLPEVTQPLPEHKTDQSGQSQDANEDNVGLCCSKCFVRYDS
jgi:hypothetical protein